MMIYYLSLYIIIYIYLGEIETSHHISHWFTSFLASLTLGAPRPQRRPPWTPGAPQVRRRRAEGNVRGRGGEAGGKHESMGGS